MKYSVSVFMTSEFVMVCKVTDMENWGGIRSISLEYVDPVAFLPYWKEWSVTKGNLN